jgi:hypothetical protein
LVALALAGCAGDPSTFRGGHPFLTEPLLPIKIERASQTAAACDRLREIGRAAFNPATKREHAIDLALCWIERNSSYRNLPPPRLWFELSPSPTSAV